LYFANTGCSQNVAVSVSEMLKTKIGSNVASAGKIGDNIYIIKNEDFAGSEMSLQIYNAGSMELISIQEIKSQSCRKLPNCVNKQYDFEDAFFLRDRIVLFFNKFNLKLKQHQLFAQFVNRTGEFIGSLTLLDSIPASIRKKKGSFSISMSDDSTKFLILQNPEENRLKKNEEYHFKVFDNELTLVHELNQTFEIKDRLITIDDYIVGNNGKIYLLCNVKVPKKEKVKGDALHYYILYTIDSRTKSVSENKLQVSEKQIETVAIQLNNEKQVLYCSGLYSEIAGKKHRGRDIDGFFFLKIDQNTSEVISESFKRLDKGIVDQLSDFRKSSKKKDRTNARNENEGISKNFSIQHLLDRADGSIMVVTELRYNYNTTMRMCDANGNCSINTTNHFVRNNILAMNISPEGEIVWFVDIPKYQHTTDDNGYFSSFGLLEKNDSIVFIYNSNDVCAYATTVKDVFSTGDYKKTCLVATAVDIDGTFNQTKVFDNSLNLIISAPERVLKICDGVYIAPAYKMPKGIGLFSAFFRPSTGLMKYELH